MFCVPGESYIAVLDALHDSAAVQVVTCRHEGGAGLMAVADAKLTGRAGTCFVSRGPGATNAAIAVHTAQQDACPLVLFVGQVVRKDIGRRAFQEVDYRRTFADMAKWVEEVHDPDRLPEIAARAYHIAESGTPGPVVVSLPEDMLEEASDAAPAGPRPRPRGLPSEQDVQAVAARLAEAERPVLIAGGGLDADAARAALLALAEAWRLPVATSFKRQDMFPNAHDCFAGHLGYGIPPDLGRALHEADLILAVGTRLGDVTSQGFTLPRPGQTLVHVYPDPDSIGRNFPAELVVVADAPSFDEALLQPTAPPSAPGRAAWIGRLHGIYEALGRDAPRDAADGVDFGHLARALAEQAPPDLIITNDAGNFSGFMHRYVRFNGRMRLVAAVSGAMGLGVPAAIAAKLRHPERQVVALVGDGGFLMTGAELATAVAERAAVRIVVSNNGAFGTIRQHQEKRYPGRIQSTGLANPDFAALARAYGATGLTASTADEVPARLADLLAADGPALLEVRSSLENISAFTTISRLRGA